MNLDALIRFYHDLTIESVARFPEFYADDAWFKDPFNEVRGLPAIRKIFEDMFERLADCRFEMIDAVSDPSGSLITWDMTFRFRSYRPDAPQKIHGASHLKFDAAGRIVYHRDYWDAADELYAKLPVIGPVMRYLKRRMA